MSKGFQIEIMGKTIKAEYLTDKAPEICKAMEEASPFDGQALHAKFAGQEIIVMVPFYADPENEILNVVPGDIGYYPGRQTICIFYGKTKPFGKVSVFAKVTEGLDDLMEVGNAILEKGVLTLKEDSLK